MQNQMRVCKWFSMILWNQLLNGTDQPGYFKVAIVNLMPLAT